MIEKTNRAFVMSKADGDNIILVVSEAEVAIIDELLDLVPGEEISNLDDYDRDSYCAFHKKLRDAWKQWDEMKE